VILEKNKAQLMNKYVGSLLGLLMMLFCHQSKGQDELFHELRLEKILIEKEEWELIGEADWKHLYNEPGWRRWGGSVFGVWNPGPIRLSAGTNGYYTFNRSITNFFELRPWTAINHSLSLGSKISLRQRVKVEWRFFYDEGDAPREDYRRLRYQIGFDIPLTTDAHGHEASWRVRPYFEWFFIRDPATFERYPNERDYGLTLIKRLGNHHELSLGYKMEEFYRTENDHGNGHIILIGYSL
jgi:hypothetical protein